MERFLAAAALVALGFAQWAANVPLELWVIKGNIASGVLGVSFWSLRSADLAHLSGQGNYVTASAISALLALAIGLYCARAVRSLAFWARFNADDG